LIKKDQLNNKTFDAKKRRKIKIKETQNFSKTFPEIPNKLKKNNQYLRLF